MKVVPITVLAPSGAPVNAYGITDGVGLALRANGNVLYALSEPKATEIAYKTAAFATRYPSDFVGWGHNHQPRVVMPPVVTRPAPAPAAWRTDVPTPTPGPVAPYGRRVTPAPIPAYAPRPRGADRTAAQCAASLRNKIAQAPRIVAGLDRTDPAAYMAALETSCSNFLTACRREGVDAESLRQEAEAAANLVAGLLARQAAGQ